MFPLIKHYLGDPGSLFHVRHTPSQGRPSWWRRRWSLSSLDRLAVGLTQLGHQDLPCLCLLLPLHQFGQFEGPPARQRAGAGAVAGAGLLLTRLVLIFPLLAVPS